MFRRAPSSAMIGHSAETRPLWVLNGLPHAAARDVEQWLEHIGQLSVDEWLRIAERCDSIDRAPLATTRACRRIERIIATEGLEFTAWLVRDLVESATHTVRHAASRQPRQVRARISVARVAAEWAALAKACQQWLSPAELDLLCGPFAEPSLRRASAAV